MDNTTTTTSKIKKNHRINVLNNLQTNGRLLISRSKNTLNDDQLMNRVSGLAI